MAQNGNIARQPQPLNNENISPSPGGVTATTKGSSREETTEAANSKAGGSNDRKRRASNATVFPSTLYKRPRNKGCFVKDSPTRRDDDSPDQYAPGDSPARYLTDEEETGEAAGYQDGLAAEHPALPDWAPRMPSPTNTPHPTHNATTPLSAAVGSGQRAWQVITGLERLSNGAVVDRGSGPNPGPPGYLPAGRETASQGLNRIVEEAVAAPRRPLPRVLSPLPNGRYPLPTAPVRKDDGAKEEEKEKNGERAEHGE